MSNQNQLPYEPAIDIEMAIEAAEHAHCDLEQVTWQEVHELHQEMQREHRATHNWQDRFPI